MIVVSNTSPLIAFAKINQFAILQQLFGTLTVPEAVLYEFLNNCTSEEGVRFMCARREFIEVAQIKNCRGFSRKLGHGEQEAFSLALQQSADILLMDDRKACNEAKDRHIVVASTRTILKIAEKRGCIESYQAIEERLRQQNFYIPNY